MEPTDNANQKLLENIILVMGLFYFLMVAIFGINAYFTRDITYLVPMIFVLSICFAPPNLLLIHFSGTQDRKILLIGIFPMLVFFGLFLFVFIIMTTQGFGMGRG